MRPGLKILTSIFTALAIIFLVYIIYFIFWVLPNNGGLPHLQTPATSLTIDFKTCFFDNDINYNNIYYTPTSSILYLTFGEQLNKSTRYVRSCIFRHTDINGKWINCRVPISLATTTFNVSEYGVDFSSIEEYCGYEEIMGGPPLPQVPANNLTIDFDNCFTGDQSSFNILYYTPTSSIEYEIFGKDYYDYVDYSNFCYFRYRTDDKEWNNCWVPYAVATTTFNVNKNGVDFSSIEEYCGYASIFKRLNGVIN